MQRSRRAKVQSRLTTAELSGLVPHQPRASANGLAPPAVALPPPPAAPMVAAAEPSPPPRPADDEPPLPASLAALRAVSVAQPFAGALLEGRRFVLSQDWGSSSLAPGEALDAGGPFHLPVDGSGRWLLLHAAGRSAASTRPELAALKVAWPAAPMQNTMPRGAIVGALRVDGLARMPHRRHAADAQAAGKFCARVVEAIALEGGAVVECPANGHGGKLWGLNDTPDRQKALHRVCRALPPRVREALLASDPMPPPRTQASASAPSSEQTAVAAVPPAPMEVDDLSPPTAAPSASAVARWVDPAARVAAHLRHCDQGGCVSFRDHILVPCLRCVSYRLKIGIMLIDLTHSLHATTLLLGLVGCSRASKVGPK